MANWKRLLAVVAAVIALDACSLLESEPLDPPVVNLRALEPLAMGLNSQVFRARLSLYNPNAVALSVTGGEVQLDLAGVRAANGRTMEPFSVPAGEAKEVDIRISTNLLRDLPKLFTALTTGAADQGLDYALTGHVNVKRRGVDRLPISSRGQLTIPSAIPGSAEPGPAAPGAIL